MPGIRIILVIIGTNIPNDFQSELTQIFFHKEQLFALRSPIYFHQEHGTIISYITYSQLWRSRVFLLGASCCFGHDLVL
eukprot:6321404-Ditylum_brightwellii.AAC.1